MPGTLHRTGQINWLRAAAWGANDGILCLVLGVAAAQGTANNISQTEGPMRDRASDFSTKPRQLP
jgi:hypothetical protein